MPDMEKEKLLARLEKSVPFVTDHFLRSAKNPLSRRKINLWMRMGANAALYRVKPGFWREFVKVIVLFEIVREIELRQGIDRQTKNGKKKYGLIKVVLRAKVAGYIQSNPKTKADFDAVCDSVLPPNAFSFFNRKRVVKTRKPKQKPKR